MLLWFCVYLVILIVPTMASFEDIQEIAAEDILCDPKSHRAGRGGNSNFIVGYYRVLQQIVAIKIYGVTDVIQDESLILKSVKKEIKHMQLARHDNVVQVFGFVKWLFHFGIVMEYCKAGDLRSFVFSPNVDLKTGLLIRILTEIAKGMAFLHNLTEKHLVHGNVKPENILLTKKLNIKISDFGNSKLVSLSKSLLKSKQLNTNFTPIYTAPEKLLAPDMEPTKELDVYAFAITTYVVLSRQLPFLREHWSKTTSAIIAGRRPDCKKITDWMLTLNSEDKKYIEIVKNLMTECWESDSNKRPCMSKVADKLQYLLDQQDQSALDQQVKNVATAFDFEKYDFFIEGQAFSLNLFSFSRQGYSIERNPHVLTHTWRNVRLLQKTFVASVPTESLKKPDASKSSAVAVTDLIDFSNGQHASATVGKGGGSLECDGCKVIIPPNALLNDVEIEISCLNKEKNVNLFRLTPLLRCKPHGLTFETKIEIFLPTIYRARKDALTVAVRKAKDESSTFDIIRKDLLRCETHCFKFFTDQFSLFDVILFRFKQKVKLLREKVLIFGVTPDPTDAPLEIVSTVLVCHNKKSATFLNNMNKLIETNFLLKYEDRELDVQLSGEHLDVVTAEIRNTQCERDENPFTLKKKNGQGWTRDNVEICLKSKSQETLVKKNIPITKENRAPHPLPGVQSNFTNCTLGNPTIATSLSHHDSRNTDV